MVVALASLGLAQDARKSGFEFMQPATQALQKDDTQNPAMLWVKDGQAIWAQRDGTADKSCAECHGEINRMRGVATRYPQYSGDAKRVINLSQQINQCRMTRQLAKPWPVEDATLLGLEAAIATESRGLLLAPPSCSRVVAFAGCRCFAIRGDRSGSPSDALAGWCCRRVVFRRGNRGNRGSLGRLGRCVG